MKIYIIQLLLKLAETLYLKLKESHKLNMSSQLQSQIEKITPLLISSGQKELADKLSGSNYVQVLGSSSYNNETVKQSFGSSCQSVKQVISVKKIHPDAQLPTRSTGNAGYDLYSVEDVVIQPLERKLIKTGIAIRPPTGYYGSIRDRSGMAFKNGGHVLGGVIDENYSGDVGVILYNTNKEQPITVNIGDRPAQIVFEKYLSADIIEVNELPATDRGANGFGSSGGVQFINQNEQPK